MDRYRIEQVHENSFYDRASMPYRDNLIIDQFDEPHMHNYEEYAFPDITSDGSMIEQMPRIYGESIPVNMNVNQHVGDRQFNRQPYGFYGGGFGSPFLGGVLGGLVGSAFYNPYYYNRPPYYYGYPYPPYGWY